MQFMKR